MVYAFAFVPRVHGQFWSVVVTCIPKTINNCERSMSSRLALAAAENPRQRSFGCRTGVRPMHPRSTCSADKALRLAADAPLGFCPTVSASSARIIIEREIQTRRVFLLSLSLLHCRFCLCYAIPTKERKTAYFFFKLSFGIS